jgi:hypothetical protein
MARFDNVQQRWEDAALWPMIADYIGYRSFRSQVFDRSFDLGD